MPAPIVDGGARSRQSLRWSAIRFARSGDGAHPADAGTFVLGAAAVLAPSMAGSESDVLARAGSSSRRPASGSWSSPAAPGPAGCRTGDGCLASGPLEPLALLTFDEELRPEAQATIDGLRARGIDVKIVSGDDPSTVAAIGRQLGIGGRHAGHLGPRPCRPR